MCPLAPYIVMHSMCPLAPYIFLHALFPLAPYIFMHSVCPFAPYTFLQSVCPLTSPLEPINTINVSYIFKVTSTPSFLVPTIRLLQYDGQPNFEEVAVLSSAIYFRALKWMYLNLEFCVCFAITLCKIRFDLWDFPNFSTAQHLPCSAAQEFLAHSVHKLFSFMVIEP